MASKSRLECAYCQTEDVSVECKTCDGHFCKKCDEKFHNHPNRQKHIRKAIVSSSFAQCNSCGSDNIEYVCTNCEEQQLFCTTCDDLFHEHEERQGHVRQQFRHLSHLTVDDGIHCCHCHSICTVKCNDCNRSFCRECDQKYHDYPNLEDHTRKELKRVCYICEELSVTARCDKCSGWYCDECDEFRHKKKLASHIRKQIQKKSPKEEIICGLEEQNKELTKSVEEYKTALAQLNVKKDSIVLEKEAQIQDLENNFKSLQDRHQMEKVHHNSEIQTKDSLIEEHIAKARRQKEQTDSLEKENRDLQNQIKTLSHKEGIWKKCSSGDIPEDGVVANDGITKLYVCRAELDGDVVAGWISPAYKVCYLYHNGSQHSKCSYDVLVPNSSFEWHGCHGDEIPPRAVPGGKTKEGEVLFIGRIKHTDGNYYVGKVQPSVNGCYNHPRVNERFTIYAKYEILVWK